ncbi:putative cell differentiation protein RCD1 -like protein isoform X1 [Capsicum annuum]|nr:putative cell differentiation protein RCD1 -like protein isoform X1 [Capsicum annuum]
MQSSEKRAILIGETRFPPSPAEEETTKTAMEQLLKYQFKNRKLLEEALTHSSYPNSSSINYQRLAFIGDASLSLAISSYFFVTYPEIDCGKLTDLRAVNVSTEKLARVAVRHGLYNYLRRDSAVLDEKNHAIAGKLRNDDHRK